MVKLFTSYIFWHYTVALKEIFVIWKNFLLFIWESFSISILARTFFSPWRRLDEEKPGLSKPKAFLSSLIINIFTRFLGMVFRAFVLLIAFIILSIFLVSGVLALLLWPLMPVLLIVALMAGLYFLL